MYMNWILKEVIHKVGIISTCRYRAIEKIEGEKEYQEFTGFVGCMDFVDPRTGYFIYHHTGHHCSWIEFQVKLVVNPIL